MTEYTGEQLAKIAGPKSTMITRAQAADILDVAATAPRMYAIYDGQIVKLSSTYYLEKYNPEHIWISGTTIADLVGRA